MSILSRLTASVALPMLFALPATAETTITLTEAFGPAANWALHADDSWLAKRAGCYEGLTRISNNITVEPGLATAWTQTGDLTWDFTIREGVTFHDGTALNAETVANALTRLLAAEVPARAFSPKIVASVEATGPMTVTITTVAPLVTLPGRLAARRDPVAGRLYRQGDQPGQYLHRPVQDHGRRCRTVDDAGGQPRLLGR